MQLSGWAPEHSEALRKYVSRGMSYGEAARAINARFGTAYSRNAAICRGKRMGLAVPGRQQDRPTFVPRSQRLPAKNPKTSRKRRVEEAKTAPVVQRIAPPKLRCVGLSPRLVSLIDLAEGECHYPYGGDKEGEAITFCGHPCFRGSVYCAPHFHLTRGPDAEAERRGGPVVLRLVDAA